MALLVPEAEAAGELFAEAEAIEGELLDEEAEEGAGELFAEAEARAGELLDEAEEAEEGTGAGPGTGCQINWHSIIFFSPIVLPPISA